MAFTAIIPARAGSKGIPGKNLWAYKGVSLLARAIRLAHRINGVERVIVSTDAVDMQSIARAEGADCETLRPHNLATDTATTAAVVEHLIHENRIISDHLLLLQVTAPLRTLADAENFIAAYLASGAPAATSIVRHDEPRPEKLQRLHEGRIQPYLASGYEGPRQALPQPYALNGAFYAISRHAFLREKKFLPQGTLGFEMPPERSLNLDTPQDLAMLEAMLAAGHWRLEG
jgi:CMP-N,N'-diacetyllegionaminic acid synthase